MVGQVINNRPNHRKVSKNHIYNRMSLKLLPLFSVPFDEDDHDKSVWYIDHDYLESMYTMFKKVNGEFGYKKID